MKTNLFNKYNIMNQMTIHSAILICSFFILLSGCNDKSESLTSSSTKWIKCELKFIDSTSESRSIIYEFPDSSIIYIKFNLDEIDVLSKAIYSVNTKNWTIEFPNELLNHDDGTCSIAYADIGEISPHDTFVNLGLDVGNDTSIMMTMEGEWKLSDNIMIIRAHLKPALSRIRFVSNSPEEIWVKGFGIPNNTDSRFVFKADESSPNSIPCYPKHIIVDKQEKDGRYYSKYYYSYSTTCEDIHYAIEGGKTDCPEYLKLLVYYPNDTEHYFLKNTDELIPGESYIVELPSSTNNQEWETKDNKIRSYSGVIKIGDGVNMNHKYIWDVGVLLFGKSVNFELNTNSIQGYAFVSNTTFGGAGAYQIEFTNDKISAIYTGGVGFYGGYKDRLIFQYNISDLNKYYAEFKNITISQFPIYNVYGE